MANFPQPFNTYQTQIDSIGNRKDLTKALMAQALAPQENQNAFTGLARVMSAYLAKKGMTSADAEQQELIKQQSEARRQELSRVLGQTKDRPAETAQPNVVGPPAPAMKGMPLDQALMSSSIPEFQDMGLKRALDAKAINAGGELGTYNPRDYTTGSWAKFVQSRDPSTLERFSPRRNVDIGGVPHVFDPVLGDYVPATLGTPAPAGAPAGAQPAGKPITAADVAADKAIIAEAEAAAKARGESAGGQDNKAPVFESMSYVMGQYEELLPKLSTGGPLGIAGKASELFDSQDVMRFENLNQQLSTELRTIYRIPGEGSLSDQEQKQYGLQLPSINYDEATNRAILKDLNARTRLRLGMPVDGVTPQGGGAVAQNSGQPAAQQKTGAGSGGGFKLLNVRAK